MIFAAPPPFLAPPEKLPLDRVYDILVARAGASEAQRAAFHQTFAAIGEYRIKGVLGFGGRVWQSERQKGHRYAYVTCYREDQNAETVAVVARVNAALREITY